MSSVTAGAITSTPSATSSTLLKSILESPNANSSQVLKSFANSTDPNAAAVAIAASNSVRPSDSSRASAAAAVAEAATRSSAWQPVPWQHFHTPDISSRNTTTTTASKLPQATLEEAAALVAARDEPPLKIQRREQTLGGVSSSSSSSSSGLSGWRRGQSTYRSSVPQEGGSGTNSSTTAASSAIRSAVVEVSRLARLVLPDTDQTKQDQQISFDPLEPLQSGVPAHPSSRLVISPMGLPVVMSTGQPVTRPPSIPASITTPIPASSSARPRSLMAGRGWAMAASNTNQQNTPRVVMASPPKNISSSVSLGAPLIQGSSPPACPDDTNAPEASTPSLVSPPSALSSLQSNIRLPASSIRLVSDISPEFRSSAEADLRSSISGTGTIGITTPATTATAAATKVKLELAQDPTAETPSGSPTSQKVISPTKTAAPRRRKTGEAAGEAAKKPKSPKSPKSPKGLRTSPNAAPVKRMVTRSRKAKEKD